MKLIYLATALCIAAGISTSPAQNVPPPKAPILRRAPAFASWTIQFKYKADEKNGDKKKAPDAPQSDPVVSLTVTKTNKTYREKIEFKSGKHQEKWVLDGLELMKMSETNSIIPISTPTHEEPSPDYADYRKSDFKRFEWVSMESYKGIKDFQSKPAYTFEGMGLDGKNMVAYLSTDTQLPIFCSDWETTRIYTYNPPPTAPLVPPGDFLEVIKRYKNAVEALKYHPSLP